MRIRKVAGGILSPSLSYLQKQQIEIGKANGLTCLQLIKIRKPWLNYRQMEQIRLGLENGLAASQIRQYADCSNSAEQMRTYRIALENSERIHPEVHPFAAATGIISGLAAVLFLLYVFFFKPFNGNAQNSQLVLELTETSIQLECGEVFEPSQYVKDSSDHSAQLIYPEDIDTSVPGSHTAVYQLISDTQEAIQTMRVRVVDKIAPDLQLVCEEADYSDFDEPFNCRSYIAYAKDEVDGTLTDEVSCSSLLHETGLQEVAYRVSDSSGNTALKTLRVNVIPSAENTGIQNPAADQSETVQNEPETEEAYIQEEIVIEGEWIYEEVNGGETEVTHDMQ